MIVRRLKVIADPASIAFCRVIDLESGGDVLGVVDIKWQYDIEGRGTVVLTFAADMIDFEATVPKRIASPEE